LFDLASPLRVNYLTFDMPLLKLDTTVVLSDDKRTELLASLSKIVAETIGKPQQYVMVVIGQADILMSGKPGGAAFVDIRSIGGLNDDVNRQLSQKVCGKLNESLGISQERVYLNFTEVAAGNWGWNGSTF
jgi:phenylpyruvate tautomerase PptA (4-oxalocrotonate tautomerase family)